MLQNVTRQMTATMIVQVQHFTAHGSGGGGSVVHWRPTQTDYKTATRVSCWGATRATATFSILKNDANDKTFFQVSFIILDCWTHLETSLYSAHTLELRS